MPLNDVRILVDIGMGTTDLVVAKIIRRDSYFTALLIAAAGSVAAGDEICKHSCGNLAAGTTTFASCVRVIRYQHGACANCIWKSHAAKC